VDPAGLLKVSALGIEEQRVRVTICDGGVRERAGSRSALVHRCRRIDGAPSQDQLLVDGAKEIYESLASLKVPGYVPHALPPELTDAVLNGVLLAFQRLKSDTPAIESILSP
jgi:hypothetical protein